MLMSIFRINKLIFDTSGAIINKKHDRVEVNTTNNMVSNDKFITAFELNIKRYDVHR